MTWLGKGLAIAAIAETAALARLPAKPIQSMECVRSWSVMSLGCAVSTALIIHTGMQLAVSGQAIHKTSRI